jgi:catechol 2,3-dioxygenase-like lactoylglutathione lyase family enzyme
MGINVTKSSIDLGIITKDAEPMLIFYRDVVGLSYQAKVDMPGGTTMHRLLAGDSVIKILVQAKEPAAVAPSGGVAGATGYRYWTITIDNLEEVTAQCAEAGYKVPVSLMEVRPGVRISMVEDPDGNWVEFLELT